MPEMKSKIYDAVIVLIAGVILIYDFVTGTTGAVLGIPIISIPWTLSDIIICSVVGGIVYLKRGKLDKWMIGLLLGEILLATDYGNLIDAVLPFPELVLVSGMLLQDKTTNTGLSCSKKPKCKERFQSGRQFK